MKDPKTFLKCLFHVNNTNDDNSNNDVNHNNDNNNNNDDNNINNSCGIVS